MLDVDGLGTPAFPNSGAPAFGARVLVADDDPDVRNNLCTLLSAYWQVETAADGEQALALAREHAPELVLADVVMPKLDGFYLLRAIRADPALKTIAVVLYSGRSSDELAVDGRVAGADDYLVKPISAREVVARIGALLTLSRLRRREAELNAFRVRLSDAIRSSNDPFQIQRTAMQVLGEQLRVERVLYAEVTPDFDTFVIEDHYVRGGTPRGPRLVPIRSFGSAAAKLGVGEPFRVDDATQMSAMTSEEKEACLAADARATLTVPLIKDGRWVANWVLQQATPRRWSDDDLELLGEAAERTWAAVARARAEAALRASEERQAFLLTLADRLRATEEPETIAQQACTLLGQHLGLSRCIFADVDGGTFIARPGYVNGVRPMPELPIPLPTFGAALLGAYERGESVVVDDVTRDPRFTAEERTVYAAAQVAAFIRTPLIQRGRVVAAVGLHQNTPRAWSQAEADLSREFIDRVWEALERTRSEQALRRSEEALRAMNETLEERVHSRTEQVRALASRLTMAEQEERRRISQVLHDDLQQLLYALEFRLALVQGTIEQKANPKLARSIKEARGWISQAVTTTRRLTVDLSPPILQSQGLVDALDWLQRQMLELHGLQVELEGRPESPLEDDDLRVLLFQIVRELQFNEAKHAGTDRATVRLEETPEQLVIHVIDDGRGFDVEALAATTGAGFGLFSIRERLALLGGRVDLQSRPGGGAHVQVFAPRSAAVRIP